MLSKAQIVAQFEKDFERCKQQMGNVHQDYKDDKEFFLLDKQWSKAEQDARNPKDQPPRPTLTVNRMRQFLMQVINDHKQSRMGIKVSPGGGEEDKDLAQVRQGIVRAIERNNGGQAAYGQAKTDQVAGGFGAWRLYADYISPTSFEQEPKYLPIWDCTKLSWPIKDCMEADYSDMDCAIIQEDWSEHKFKAKFGKDPADFLTIDKNPHGAWGGNGPTVSEYYFKREIKETLVKAIDGSDRFLSDLEKEAEEAGQPVELFLATNDNGERIERETTRCEIWWAKLAGKEVIGKPVKLPGQWIPVFIANGRKVVVNGTVHLWSLGRPAKDTQRSHNYAASAEMERLALSPKAPFVTAVGSIPVTEKNKWATLNTGNHPYVQFHAYDPNTKQPLPPPKRTDPIQSDPGFLNLKASTVDEMKAVLGMYDPSLGKQGNAVSGVAINAQTRQGDNATFDFADNMAIAMRHCGRVLNEWIPAYIDTPRQIQMIGDDDREKVIRVNEDTQDEQGKPYAYWMDRGKFNIDITMGPSAATKRQETVESMKEFYQAFPPAAAVTGHLFAKEQDWRYADEFSKILKKMAGQQFPGVIEPEPGEEQQGQQIPPEIQQKMQQMQEQLQQVGPEMQKLQEAAQQASQRVAQVTFENQGIKAQREIEAQKVRIEEFNAITNRLKVVNDSRLSERELQLKTISEMNKVDLAGQKMRQDANLKQADGFAKVQMHREGLQAKTSAQSSGKPTGARPGKPATAKAK
jgi:hypothetical protein